MDLQELQARVCAQEDREAIRETIARMNWLSDAGDAVGHAALYTEDVAYDVGAFGVFRGREELRKFFEQVYASFRLREHRTSNLVIELRGDKASVRCYWQAHLIFQSRALISSGKYEDEWVNLNGRWLCAARKAPIAYLSPLEEGWARTPFLDLSKEMG
ncbi:MAG: nuclear transport factor 2 family protein [Acidobacteriia bacterium]|nr:nuclear transport factor 2 family protein [Terriglobia bacterium]